MNWMSQMDASVKRSEIVDAVSSVMRDYDRESGLLNKKRTDSHSLAAQRLDIDSRACETRLRSESQMLAV